MTGRTPLPTVCKSIRSSRRLSSVHPPRRLRTNHHRTRTLLLGPTCAASCKRNHTCITTTPSELLQRLPRGNHASSLQSSMWRELVQVSIPNRETESFTCLRSLVVALTRKKPLPKRQAPHY